MSDGQIRPLDLPSGTVTRIYLLDTVVTLVVVGIGYALLRGWIDAPISFIEPWASRGGVWDGLSDVWFIFGWAFTVPLVVGVVRVIRRKYREYEPIEYFVRGGWLSLNAGFFEEIVYRWLMLFSMMIFLKVMNVITFGLVKWFFMTVLVPLANWASFGLLEAQFYGDYGWLFAAAIVSANVRFRRGHEYQGLFGTINAWYMGLFLFYLMFNYGLWTAIVAHIVYDLIIFWTRAILANFQRRNEMYHVLRRIFS